MRSLRNCCRPSLKSWVKTVAIWEMIVCIVIIVPTTLLMINTLFGGSIAVFCHVYLGIKRQLQFTLLCTVWIIVFINLILNIHLFRGASRKSLAPCQIWLSVNGALLLVGYLWSLMSINLFAVLDERAVLIGLLASISSYKCFEMLIVFKYLRKLKKETVEIYTLTPTAPPIRNSIAQIRYEAELVGVTTSTEGEDRTRRPCSTFENVSMPRSIDVERVTCDRF